MTLVTVNSYQVQMTRTTLRRSKVKGQPVVTEINIVNP